MSQKYPCRDLSTVEYSEYGLKGGLKRTCIKIHMVIYFLDD